jgi:hypothetical protein
MLNVIAEIDQALRRVGGDRALDLATIQADHALVDDLGFKSIDLARIIAILRIRLNADPFARLVPITEVRTVGDLRAAYEACLAGNLPSPPADNAGQSRARARLDARQRRGQAGPASIVPTGDA